MERLKPEAEVKLETLLNIAAVKAKWLTNPELRFQDSVLHVSGIVFGKLPISISLEVDVENQYVSTTLLSLSVAHVTLPLRFFRALTNKTISLAPNDEMLFNLDIHALEESKRVLHLRAVQ